MALIVITNNILMKAQEIEDVYLQICKFYFLPFCQTHHIIALRFPWLGQSGCSEGMGELLWSVSGQ